MPNVIVQYRQELTDSTNTGVLHNLRRAIRVRAMGELSVKGRQLTERDFSFMFLREGPDDDLIADVQVIILAHADGFRVRLCDALAESIGQAVAEVLGNLKCYHQREFMYSVTLFLGEMGYYERGITTWDTRRFSDPDAPVRLEDPLEELLVSVRVYNDLKRMGINTIAEVEGSTEQELLSIPHLGAKGVEEIKGCLERLGLHLSDEESRDQLPEWVVNRDELRRQRDEQA